jgi:hypothetical protein
MCASAALPSADRNFPWLNSNTRASSYSSSSSKPWSRSFCFSSPWRLSIVLITSASVARALLVHR